MSDEERRIVEAFERLRRALLAVDALKASMRKAKDELTSADGEWRALARREK